MHADQRHMIIVEMNIMYPLAFGSAVSGMRMDWWWWLGLDVKLYTNVAEGNFACVRFYTHTHTHSGRTHKCWRSIFQYYMAVYAQHSVWTLPATQFADFTPLSLAHIFNATVHIECNAHISFWIGCWKTLHIEMLLVACEAMQCVCVCVYWEKANSLDRTSRETVQRASSNRCRRRARCGSRSSHKGSHKRRLHREYNPHCEWLTVSFTAWSPKGRSNRWWWNIRMILRHHSMDRMSVSDTFHLINSFLIPYCEHDYDFVKPILLVLKSCISCRMLNIMFHPENRAHTQHKHPFAHPYFGAFYCAFAQGEYRQPLEVQATNATTASHHHPYIPATE